MSISMSIIKYLGVFATSAALLSGCEQPAPEEPTDSLYQKGGGQYLANNGNTYHWLEGMLANTSFPGLKSWTLNGVTYWYVMSTSGGYGAPIDSITYGGQTVTQLWVDAGMFNVTLANGTSVAIDGSTTLSLHVGSPNAGTLRISKSSVVNPNPGQRYVATFARDGYLGTSYVCSHTIDTWAYGTQTTTTVNEALVPISGNRYDLNTGNRTVDSTAITLACGHDPIGQCVAWGYLPWDGYFKPSGTFSFTWVSLESNHLACTRMKRADFCGDGTSWTLPSLGTSRSVQIQIWDTGGYIWDMSPQTRDTMEAMWTPSGASCINPARMREGMSTSGFDAQTSCGAAKPPCSGTSYTGQMGSGRPCTANATGGYTCN